MQAFRRAMHVFRRTMQAFRRTMQTFRRAMQTFRASMQYCNEPPDDYDTAMPFRRLATGFPNPRRDFRKLQRPLEKRQRPPGICYDPPHRAGLEIFGIERRKSGPSGLTSIKCRPMKTFSGYLLLSLAALAQPL